MSDEPKDAKPAKLKLSRDLKAQDAENKDPAEKSPPSMKLKRKEPVEAPPNEPAASPPAPVSETPAPNTPAPPPTEGEGGKPGFDPTNPFGDAIKQGEIKTPDSPPPELPSKPAPRIDDGSGTKVEEAIHSIEEDKASSTKSHLLPSLITLFVLLLVLAGAGYGLWIVLKSPTDADEAGTAKASETAKEIEPAKKGPIQKAKDAIAKVPVADVEAITSVEVPAETPAEALSESVAETPAETPAETSAETRTEAPAQPLDKNFDPQPTASTDAIEATKQRASQYLSGIHIGGVRKGEHPIILIDGQSFQVGDIVEAETELKFDGLRKGKLAFRDSNGIIYLKSF